MLDIDTLRKLLESEPPQGRMRTVMIRYAECIQVLLGEGYSLRKIHSVFKKKEIVTCSYAGFRKSWILCQSKKEKQPAIGK